MPGTTYYPSADLVVRGGHGDGHGAPRIAGAALALPAHRYEQDEVAVALTTFGEPGFMRVTRN